MAPQRNPGEGGRLWNKASLHLGRLAPTLSPFLVRFYFQTGKNVSGQYDGSYLLGCENLVFWPQEKIAMLQFSACAIKWICQEHGGGVNTKELQVNSCVVNKKCVCNNFWIHDFFLIPGYSGWMLTWYHGWCEPQISPLQPRGDSHSSLCHISFLWGQHRFQS